MKVKTTIIFLFLSVFSIMKSTAQDWAWASSAGGTDLERATDVAVDNSGNSYITGWYNSSAAAFGTTVLTNNTVIYEEDFFLAKLDGSGNFMWALSANGPGDQHGSAIAIGPSGNIYVTGFYEDTMHFGTDTFLVSGNTKSLFVAKYSNSGSFMWARAGTGNGHNVGNDIDVDQQGNVYVAGQFQIEINIEGNIYNAISGPMGDGFVAKFDTHGNFDWLEKIGGTGVGIGVGSQQDANVLSLTPDGNTIYVGGWFKGYTTWGGVGGILDTSSHFPSLNLVSVYIAKYNSAGTIQWVKKGDEYQVNFGGAPEIMGIGADNSGNVYMAGNVGDGLIFDGDSIEIVAPTASWDYDAFIVMYNASGAHQYTNRIGLDGKDRYKALDVEPAGDHYVVGTYENAVPVGNLTLPVGTHATLVIKFDALGHPVWIKGATAAYMAEPYGIAYSPDDEVVIAGDYNSQATYGTHAMNSQGLTDAYAAKTGTGSGFDYLQEYIGFAIAPNPATENVKVIVDQKFESVDLQLFNINGQLMVASTVSGSAFIQTAHLPAGIYYIKVSTEGKSTVKKLIISH